MNRFKRFRESGLGSNRLVRSAIWLVENELVVLLAILLVFISTWAFLEVADEVQERETQTIDERIILMLRKPNNPSVPIGPLWMEEIGRDITALGGYAILTMLMLAVSGYFYLSRQRATMWYVVIAIISGYAVSMGLKAFFSRPRPELVAHLSYVSSSSFPSGHSMMSAVAYLTLGVLLAEVAASRLLKAYFLVIAMAVTVLVGCSRIYMGVHYPTDVVAGWAAGLAWATLCWIIAKQLKKRGTIAKDAASTESEQPVNQ